MAATTNEAAPAEQPKENENEDQGQPDNLEDNASEAPKEEGDAEESQ